tara:strand:- start:599 stop:1027 length:429 start_codon:yes stop_codon:yes gene_type:complete
MICAVIISLIISACAPIEKVSGYVPLESELKKLQIGVSTKAYVVKILGEPLSYRVDASETIFYIQQKVETVAFLKPRIKKREIVELKFDKSNILSSIETSVDSVSKPFDLEEKIVISEGRQLTFWQQMFGNIGNFSSEQFLN